MVKITKITVETESLTIIRRAKAFVAWCPDCRAEVEVLTLEPDGSAGGISSSQLRGWLATDRLHFWQPPAGQVQVCLTSLLRCFEPDPIRHQ